ncbi:MAG: hypothetical protein CMB48_05885 [Euryarchaeota archaeon]|nr:hypothetical protein [Euryarchaeota archaeon]
MKYVENEIKRTLFSPKKHTWSSPLGEKYSLTIPSTVYPPREDTNLLANTILNFGSGGGRKLLEIGCGTGLISIFAKSLGWDVLGCDINPLAIATSRGLAKKYNFTDLKFIEGGIEPNSETTSKIFKNGPFDMILWNLPYLEKPNENELLGPLEDASLSNIGNQKLHEILLKKIDYENALSKEGVVILIHSDKGPGRILSSECRNLGWACKSINQKILEDGEKLHATLIWKPWFFIENIDLNEVKSTNTYLLESNLPIGTLATTKNQTKGRGQRKNNWIHFKGGWCGSWLIDLEDSTPQIIQAKAALALIESIAAINGDELPTFDYASMAKFLENNISIKWPNDIMLEDKKIAGILCEAKTTGSKTKCVIGIGCNLRDESLMIKSKLPNTTSLDEFKLINNEKWTRVMHASIASKFEKHEGVNKDEDSKIINNWWLSMEKFNKTHFIIIDSKKYQINGLLADGGINLISTNNNLNSEKKCDESYNLKWEKISFN